MLYIDEEYERIFRENKGTHQKTLAKELKENGVKHEYYSHLETSESNRISGSSGMFFVRIDDGDAHKNGNKQVCDSAYLKPLFEEIMNNPNCAYKTIYNDLVKKDKYIPRYVSTLIKDCHAQTVGIKSEIFGSRVANLLHIPTNYAFGIEYKNRIPKINIFSEEEKYFALGSVDYLPFGHNIELFYEIDNWTKATNGQLFDKNNKPITFEHVKGTRPKDEASLDKWIPYIKDCLHNRYPNGIDRDSYNNFMHDFVRSYLFRVTLFRDTDFAHYNSGIISSPDSNKFEMMPNTDMEGILRGMNYMGTRSYEAGIKANIRKAINYCRRNCPEILEEFVYDLERAHKEGKIEAVLSELYPKTNNTKALFENVNRDIGFMIDYSRRPVVSFALASSKQKSALEL